MRHPVTCYLLYDQDNCMEQKRQIIASSAKLWKTITHNLTHNTRMRIIQTVLLMLNDIGPINISSNINSNISRPYCKSSYNRFLRVKGLCCTILCGGERRIILMQIMFRAFAFHDYAVRSWPLCIARRRLATDGKHTESLSTRSRNRWQDHSLTVSA